VPFDLSEVRDARSERELDELRASAVKGDIGAADESTSVLTLGAEESPSVDRPGARPSSIQIRTSLFAHSTTGGRMNKILALTGAAALLTIGVSSNVSADRAYHTERISLHSIDDAPLRSGSVVNIHANGPQVYAQERYLLNGALPNHDYVIALTVYLFDPGCEGDAITFFDVPISTNAAGNGHAKAPTITPDAVAGLEGAHGTNWIVFDDGDTAVYETGCEDVFLD
jgi:hypothetical protein